MSEFDIKAVLGSGANLALLPVVKVFHIIYMDMFSSPKQLAGGQA